MGPLFGALRGRRWVAKILQIFMQNSSRGLQTFCKFCKFRANFLQRFCKWIANKNAKACKFFAKIFCKFANFLQIQENSREVE